jgi:periplasmic divalent cation tolerance protein
MDMNDDILVVQTTLPGAMNQSEVGDWCNHAIQIGIAACIQVGRIESLYQWDGESRSSSEWSIQIKTSVASKSTVLSWLQDNHPYEVPEIIWWKVQGEEKYRDWIHEESLK